MIPEVAPISIHFFPESLIHIIPESLIHIFPERLFTCPGIRSVAFMVTVGWVDRDTHDSIRFQSVQAQQLDVWSPNHQLKPTGAATS